MVQIVIPIHRSEVQETPFRHADTTHTLAQTPQSQTEEDQADSGGQLRSSECSRGAVVSRTPLSYTQNNNQTSSTMTDADNLQNIPPNEDDLLASDAAEVLLSGTVSDGKSSLQVGGNGQEKKRQEREEEEGGEVGKDDDAVKKPAKGGAGEKPAKAAKKADGGDDGEDKPKGKITFYNRPPPAAVPNPQRGQEKIDAHPGSSTCLAGLNFVITGTLDSMQRSEAAALIQKYGGKVTGSLSGKTKYLVAGIGSGESKLEQAKKKGVEVIDEDGLFNLIDELTAAGKGD